MISFLPCPFSTNTTLESGWKLWPLMSMCSPPVAGQLSTLCLSTRGSSCAERWANNTKQHTKKSEILQIMEKRSIMYRHIFQNMFLKCTKCIFNLREIPFLMENHNSNEPYTSLARTHCSRMSYQ